MERNKIRLCVIPGTNINPGGFKNWIGNSKTSMILDYKKEIWLTDYSIGKHTL